jgi:hypothetical protein
MKVNEYRDLIDELNNRASSLNACVNDEERSAWIPYTERLRLQAWAVEGTCSRATAADKAKMDRARKALDAAYDSVIHLIPSPL